ncbi:sulfatase-like hydrolase/transferase [Thiocapsa sp. UBA6158]|jgi:arylsulfatase A-like enzyme|uniref:sulfatase-like hydrolase/transferase n=1 Tax=Thiocapsa sp. UBA6158 TaxID=1947692 RepID=UPI0025E4A58E|nr:sulfatase-like hydrolase/transferase [Thiocapsa sp. UBA6158]
MIQCTAKPSLASLFVALTLLAGGIGHAHAAGRADATSKPPNILFIVLDDIGIDQFRTFGYGGLTPPAMPNIDRIADAGVHFRNTWSMPACSVSRSVFFTGRFPLRTNLYAALGPDDLANSMLSPWETTLPKLLKERDYESALFGKFHIGLQGNNPFGDRMPASLGWDYFSGWLDETGDPSSIDTTAGGVGPQGTYACGYVPGARDGGADAGACYSGDGSCRVMAGTGPNPPGRACRDSGGIFDPEEVCRQPRPSYIDFNLMSAHYVSPLVINRPHGVVRRLPLTDVRARTYRGSVPVDAAIEWIEQRAGDKPWMATVSFATVHTPLQAPPLHLLAPDARDTNALDCSAVGAFPILSNQMIEALDTEVGRLLLETGIVKRRRRDGALRYNPENTDTMLVIVNDNGSLGYTVKQPFDGARSKGTVYQTGVWTPLIVAGPLVEEPGREVTHMTNIADLYELFGELAGIDVHERVPRTLDSMPMLPYLVDPMQDSIRQWNFTQIGLNLQADGALNGPCQFANSCSHIPVTKGVCEDNGGVWFGQGADGFSDGVPIPSEGFTYCCEVQQWLTEQVPPQDTVDILPQSGVAIRNDTFKLVRNNTKDYDPTTNACVDSESDELYEIDEARPVPKLDTEEAMLDEPFTSVQQANYDALSDQLAVILSSQPPCSGDGNIDGVVDIRDLVAYRALRWLSRGTSSWYDLDLNGLTNSADAATVRQNLGTICSK